MGNGFGRKRENIAFLDPETGRKLCSYNECYTKFNLEVILEKTTESGFKKKEKFHRCDDCRRKILSTTDKEFNEENDRQHSNFLVKSKKIK